jgi:hypothetical protein
VTQSTSEPVLWNGAILRTDWLLSPRPAVLPGLGQCLRDFMIQYLLSSLHCRPTGVPIRCHYLGSAC